MNETFKKIESNLNKISDLLDECFDDLNELDNINDNMIYDVENFIYYLKIRDSYTKKLEEEIKFYLKYYNKENGDK